MPRPTNQETRGEGTPCHAGPQEETPGSARRQRERECGQESLLWFPKEEQQGRANRLRIHWFDHFHRGCP